MPLVSLRQKILLVFFSIVTAMIITEAGLRVSAGVYLSGIRNRNVISLNKEGDYRILCLGESTTAEGGRDSYPRQLERILSQRLAPKQVSVINKGAPGVDTNFIISRLEDNLDAFKPDIVVVMMGINDRLVTASSKPENSGLERARRAIRNFAKQFKVLKLAKSVWLKKHERDILKEVYFDRAKYYQEKRNYQKAENLLGMAIGLNPGAYDGYWEFARYCNEIENYPCAQEMFVQAIRRANCDGNLYSEAGWFYQERGNFAQAQELFKAAITCSNGNTYFYIDLGQSYYLEGKTDAAIEAFDKALAANTNAEDLFLQIGDFYYQQKDYSRAEDIFNRLLKINPRNETAYVALGNLFNLKSDFGRAEDFFEKALEINPHIDAAYESIGFYYQEHQEQPKAEEIYRQYIKEVRGTDNYRRVTRKNYQKLKDIVLGRKVKLVCVQYPRRSLKPLTEIFDSNKGVIFVDNERLFKDAINKAKYEDYFIDRFAGDFGHCTAEGNSLLAVNIADVIIWTLAL